MKNGIINTERIKQIEENKKRMEEIDGELLLKKTFISTMKEVAPCKVFPEQEQYIDALCKEWDELNERNRFLSKH